MVCGALGGCFGPDMLPSREFSGPDLVPCVISFLQAEQFAFGHLSELLGLLTRNILLRPGADVSGRGALSFVNV